MSYVALDITYTWVSDSPHGMLPFIVTGQTRLPEIDFSAGSYQIQCSTSQSKYLTPITATKNIIVQ
jgi:hypothetical protein